MTGDGTGDPPDAADAADAADVVDAADIAATPETAASGDLGGTVARIDERVAAVRADATRRRIALVVGLVLGLALAWVHWFGLVAGGALVGLSRRSVPRAVLAGLGFGVLTLLGSVLAPGTVGPGALTALAPVSYLAVALGLVLPAWGALARGVV